MKKLIVALLFIVLFPSINFSKPRKVWHVCICGYKYYDWKDRHFGVLIPVLNEKNEMIQCKQ